MQITSFHHRMILSHVACLAPPYFPALSHERLGFRGKKIMERKICDLISLTTFARHISHSVKNRAHYSHKHSYSYKLPIFSFIF